MSLLLSFLWLQRSCPSYCYDKIIRCTCTFQHIGKGSWVFMFRNSYRLMSYSWNPSLQNLYSGFSLLLLLLQVGSYNPGKLLRKKSCVWKTLHNDQRIWILWAPPYSVRQTGKVSVAFRDGGLVASKWIHHRTRMKAPALESGNSERKKKSNYSFGYESKAGPDCFQTALTIAILPPPTQALHWLRLQYLGW